MTMRLILGAVALIGVAVAGVLIARPIIDAPNVEKEPTTQPAVSQDHAPAGPLDFKVNDIDGKPVDLSKYKGKVVLIVNVASRCGFTPQYKALEAIYKKYSDKGFVILGFPANDFGSQEPGTDEDIKLFCTGSYDVTFPMMSKISVKDPEKAPLYKFLTDKATAGDFGGEIGWNFTKFLVDRHGNLIARWASATKPDDERVTRLIEKALNPPKPAGVRPKSTPHRPTTAPARTAPSESPARVESKAHTQPKPPTTKPSEIEKN